MKDLGQAYDDKLPQAPPLTVTQMSKNDAEQKERGTKFQERFNVSPERLKWARAEATIKELDAIPREDFSARQSGHYVDALSVLGRYNEAFEMTGDDRFKDIWDAVWESKPCGCADFETVELEGNKVVKRSYSRRFKKALIYSLKLNSWANLMQCSDCNDICVEPR